MKDGSLEQVPVSVNGNNATGHLASVSLIGWVYVLEEPLPGTLDEQCHVGITYPGTSMLNFSG